MKNSSIAVIIVAVIVVGLLGFVVFNNQNQTTPTQQNTETTVSDNTTDGSTVTNESGTYSDYSQAAFEAAAGGRIVLFFHAAWCPSCREQDRNLVDSRNDIPADVAIFKVDYDSEGELRQRYGITLQHTFVQVDGNGNEIQKWTSLYSEYDLQSILDRI